LQFDQLRIQCREDAAKGELDVSIDGANLPRQDLGIGLSGGA
jgi:hypothetical protein